MLKYFEENIKEGYDFFAKNISILENQLSGFWDKDLLKTKTLDFVLTGWKRLRPIIARFVAKSQWYKGDFLPFLTLEAFHKYLLIHDDIIDKDDTRYWKGSVYHELERLYTWKDKAEQKHFGISCGIIAGDLMENISNNCILESSLTDEKKIQLLKIVSQALEQVAYGWYRQFLSDYENIENIKYDDLIKYNLIEVTWKYSFTFPVKFWYCLAWKNFNEKIWNNICDNLGIIFQIWDDILGLFWDPKTTWKSNTWDITQWKKTLPVFFAYQNWNSKEKEIINYTLNNHAASEYDFEIFKNIVFEKWLKDAKKVLESSKNTCLDTIDKLDNQSIKQFFTGLVEFITTRDY